MEQNLGFHPPCDLFLEEFGYLSADVEPIGMDIKCFELSFESGV
jgi:hypothetical protein